MAKSRMSLNTRFADERDLPMVYRMAWSGYKELQEIAPETVDPDLLWNWIVKAYKQAPQVLLEKDGEIIGFWGLCTIKAAWSYDTLLADYMFYVIPDHRSMKATRTLVRAVKSVADKFNMTLRLNYLFKGRLRLHERIFLMMGFKISGFVGFYKG